MAGRLDVNLDEVQVINIGRGLAINVVLIENATQSEALFFTPIGAIAPQMRCPVARDLFPDVDIPSNFERTAVWVAAESRPSGIANCVSRLDHPWLERFRERLRSGSLISQG